MKRIITTLAPFLLLIALLNTGCAAKQKPVTKEEALQLAREIEKSAVARDPNFIDNTIDLEALISNMNLKSNGLKKDARKGLKGNMDLGKVIINSLGETGTYQLLRQYEKDGTQHLLFRLYSVGGINYHDMELIHVKGKCRIADMYVYATGENISATMKDIFLKVGEQAKGYSMDDPEVKWIRSMEKLRQYIVDQKYSEAQDLFNSVPASVRKVKAFQIANIQIASGLGPEYEAKAVAEYESLFPGDPSLPLILIDPYFSKKEYGKVIDCVNKLDSAVGGDPLLNYHRSICFNHLGDAEKSRELLTKLVKEMPDFDDAVMELVATWLELGEYEKAKPYVDKIKADKSFAYPERLNDWLNAYPGYKEKYPD